MLVCRGAIPDGTKNTRLRRKMNVLTRHGLCGERNRCGQADVGNVRKPLGSERSFGFIFRARWINEDFETSGSLRNVGVVAETVGVHAVDIVTGRSVVNLYRRQWQAGDSKNGVASPIVINNTCEGHVAPDVRNNGNRAGGACPRRGGVELHRTRHPERQRITHIPGLNFVLETLSHHRAATKPLIRKVHALGAPLTRVTCQRAPQRAGARNRGKRRGQRSQRKLKVPRLKRQTFGGNDLCSG
ncbi:unannotated protein [freshwater metagenome]|uniref:Unannotated protein n=1 Tax=freshwater metagenome TaxID=449393 RepID=A0A6J7DEB5_9ZZZZ